MPLVSAPKLHLHNALRSARPVVLTTNRRFFRRVRADLRGVLDSLLGDAPNKEVVLLLLQQQSEVAVAQSEVAVAQKEVAVAQIENLEDKLVIKDLQKELVVKELQKVTGALLHAEGLLSMRGLIEYAESKLSRTTDRLTRQARWEAILENDKDLLACIKGCLRNKQSIKSIATMIVNTYSSLSGHIHQYSITSVDIVEGAINKEQMKLLQCIAMATAVPYEMHYRQNIDVAALSDNFDNDSDSDESLNSSP